jgi:hypothetical protein
MSHFRVWGPDDLRIKHCTAIQNVMSSIPSKICADFAAQTQKSLPVPEKVKNIRYSVGGLQRTPNCRSPLLTICLSFHSLEITGFALWILFPCLWAGTGKARHSTSGDSRQTSNHILRSCGLDNDIKMFFFTSF